MDEQTLSPRSIAGVDPKKVFELYESWPARAEEAIGLKVEPRTRRYGRVIYLAVGGSATAGEIISDWLLSSGGVEVSVFRGYLPKVKLDDALVVVCSTSGDTEETVRLARIMSERKVDMVTISHGGKLKELSDSKGIPHVNIKLAEAPRYTLPYSLFASIAVLRSASLLEGFEWELDEAISNMKKIGRTIASGVDLSENVAKKLGAAIAMTDPSIYASSVTKSVAARFKTSINENAKMHAHYDYAPDLFHNEVEVWENPSKELAPVFLRRAKEPDPEARALDIFASMLEKKSVKVERLDAKGEGNLSQLMTLCYTADFASYYAAIIRGVDPFPINLINDFRKAR